MGKSRHERELEILEREDIANRIEERVVYEWDEDSDDARKMVLALCENLGLELVRRVNGLGKIVGYGVRLPK